MYIYMYMSIFVYKNRNVRNVCLIPDTCHIFLYKMYKQMCICMILKCMFEDLIK